MQSSLKPDSQNEVARAQSDLQADWIFKRKALVYIEAEYQGWCPLLLCASLQCQR